MIISLYYSWVFFCINSFHFLISPWWSAHSTDPLLSTSLWITHILFLLMGINFGQPVANYDNNDDFNYIPPIVLLLVNWCHRRRAVWLKESLLCAELLVGGLGNVPINLQVMADRMETCRQRVLCAESYRHLCHALHSPLDGRAIVFKCQLNWNNLNHLRGILLFPGMTDTEVGVYHPLASQSAITCMIEIPYFHGTE